MNRMKNLLAMMTVCLTLASCVSYNAYQRAHEAENRKNWDTAVAEYEKALEIDPTNTRFIISLQRAKLEASRSHFAKGKSYRDASLHATGPDQLRLAQLSATELELTVKLDPTNQFAAVELGKSVQLAQDIIHANDKDSIDELKKRAKANISIVTAANGSTWFHWLSMNGSLHSYSRNEASRANLIALRRHNSSLTLAGRQSSFGSSVREGDAARRCSKAHPSNTSRLALDAHGFLP